MINWEIIKRLMKCFPNSFVNSELEFVAHTKSNDYFRMEDCKSELDVKCKVLEWLSRSAYKTEPYRRNDKNVEFHRFMSNGINEFLGTHFTISDMEQIYTHLGNACNHEKTIRFIESGYDMLVLDNKCPV